MAAGQLDPGSGDERASRAFVWGAVLLLTSLLALCSVLGYLALRWLLSL